MREILNHKVKLREWFRPLAPSMLEENACEVFGVEHHDPFMITVIEVAEEYKAKIPAVVHVDGTARPQMVNKDVNPRYWRLINEYKKITGIPMPCQNCILRTSIVFSNVKCLYFNFISIKKMKMFQ